MADIQPPPTYAEVILIDQKTKQARFNPIWLKWFIDLAGTINDAGGSTLNHNDLSSIQGGTANQFYHATAAEYAKIGTLNTMAAQAAGAVAITGGTIDGTAIGGTTRAAGAFTALSAAGVLRPATPAGAAQTAVSLFAGNGAPNNADGSDGDFYFRGNGTQAGNTVIYHKEAGAWVALITT